MKARPLHYFESLAAELHSQESRVRDLIGSTHWLTDGHHKEALLRGLIARHVPSSVIVTQGFVVPENGEAMSSREQDILLLDTVAEMPLFSANGTAVSTPGLLVGSIAVKSGFDSGKLWDATTCLGSIPDLPFSITPPWLGVFFFQAPERSDDLKRIARVALTAVTPKLNVSGVPAVDVAMRLGPDLFVLTSRKEESTVVRAYRCVGLSTAYFMARLLNVIARRRGAATTGFADALDALEEGLDVVELTGSSL